jgi:hypothetical protein
MKSTPKNAAIAVLSYSLMKIVAAMFDFHLGLFYSEFHGFLDFVSKPIILSQFGPL